VVLFKVQISQISAARRLDTVSGILRVLAFPASVQVRVPTPRTRVKADGSTGTLPHRRKWALAPLSRAPPRIPLLTIRRASLTPLETRLKQLEPLTQLVQVRMLCESAHLLALIHYHLAPQLSHSAPSACHQHLSGMLIPMEHASRRHQNFTLNISWTSAKLSSNGHIVSSFPNCHPELRIFSGTIPPDIALLNAALHMGVGSLGKSQASSPQREKGGGPRALSALRPCIFLLGIPWNSTGR